jgi:hypothetical protein
MEKVTAYIALKGNDQTAVLGDSMKPYQTFAAAQAALEPHAKAGKPVGIIDLGIEPRPMPKP